MTLVPHLLKRPFSLPILWDIGAWDGDASRGRSKTPRIPAAFYPLEFLCHPPKNPPVPPESFQKTRYTTSRNPLNRAPILAAPRLIVTIFRIVRPGGVHSVV